MHIDDERGRFTWLNWSAWLAAIGIHHLTPAGSLRFNHFDQVIQAAVDGQGVALGREPLIDHFLQQRKLVAPFPDRYTTPRAYYIVRASHAALRPEAQAFSDWLQEEVRAILPPSISEEEVTAHFTELPARYFQIHTSAEMIADLLLGHRLERLSGMTPEVEGLLAGAALAADVADDTLQVLLVLAARFARVQWK